MADVYDILMKISVLHASSASLAAQADRLLTKDAHQRLGERAGDRVHFQIKAARYRC